MAISWSFTSINDFINCPRAYQLKRVTKELKTVETEAMRFGTAQHLHLENRVKRKTTLPQDLAWLEPMIVKFETMPDGEIFAEDEIALTKGLKFCGWWDKTAWVRGKLDVGVRTSTDAIVLDYKTGKRKFDTDQLMLFAALEFTNRPDMQKVKTGYVWLKDKKLDTETYHREELPKLWGHFIPTVEKIEKAIQTNTFPCKPSGLCPWCSATLVHCKHAKN